MGSLDSRCYCNICLGDSGQSVSQTNSHLGAGRPLSRGCVNYPLGSEAASPCTPHPNIGHLLRLSPLTLPVSPSIILFIFLSCSLFFSLFFFFSFLQVPHISVMGEPPLPSCPQEGAVCYSSLPVSAASASRGCIFFACVCVCLNPSVQHQLSFPISVTV